MHSRLTVSGLALASVLCLFSNRPVWAANAPRVAAPAALSLAAPWAAKQEQYLDVYDTGSPGLYSGQYARYHLPNLSVLSTTAADGLGSAPAFEAGTPYFVDEASVGGGFALFEQPTGSGVQPGVQQFSGVPCQSTSLATAPSGNFYVVQYCSASVLEFKKGAAKGGGAKKPSAVLTGGNLGSSALPTFAVFDSKGNLYVGDTGGGVTYFAAGKTKAAIALATGRSQSVVQMIADTKGDVWSIHYADATPIDFPNKTRCTPDPSGSVIRYNLAERFSGGALVQQLYTATSDSAFAGTEGISIAADPQGRIYAGAFSVDSPSVVLDYDPGQSCPDDSRAFTLPQGANPQIAVDKQRRFYVTDAVDNSISAYQAGTTKPMTTITQPTGLVTPTYVAISPS